MAEPALNLLLNDQRVDAELLRQLVRVEVRESDSEPTVVALRFKLAQQPSGEYSPLDDDLFGPAVALAVDIAAPGGLPERLFSGHVTHIRPHFETIEANCYLEILGMDVASVLDVEDRVASYPDASDSEAAQQVFDRNGISATVTDTPARHLDDHQLLIQRESDWRFLKRLAKRNGFVCYFEYDAELEQVVGFFGPRPVSSQPQPDLTILRENENLEWFDVQHALVGPVRHAGTAIDPIAKQLIRSTDEPLSELLGAEDIAQATEDELIARGVVAATALLRDPPPQDAAIRRAGTGATEFDRFSVEARGQVDPLLYRGLLRARRTVLVKGVGRVLAGIWYVRAVRTTLHERTLTQTFAFTRNALGASGAEQFGQDAEEVPPE